MTSTFQDRLISLTADCRWGWKAELARHCGVSPATVTYWVSGRNRSARWTHVRAIANYFHVSEQWLSTGADGAGASPQAAFAGPKASPRAVGFMPDALR